MLMSPLVSRGALLLPLHWSASTTGEACGILSASSRGLAGPRSSPLDAPLNPAALLPTLRSHGKAHVSPPSMLATVALVVCKFALTLAVSII